MREIKFRAYLKEAKEMIYSDNMDEYKYQYQTMIRRSKEYPKEVHFQFGSRFSPIHTEPVYSAIGPEGHQGNSIIMQYTGLKDKNGKEIYEGDVVKVRHKPCRNNSKYLEPEIVGVIVWCDDLAMFRINTSDFNSKNNISGSMKIRMPHEEEKEVIGNIYENPELLKGIE